MKSLTVKEIAQIIGAGDKELPEMCLRTIETLDFRVERIEGEDEERQFQEVESVLGSDLIVAGSHRKVQWEDGWGENLKEFVESGYALSTLVPKFIRPYRPMRLSGGYYRVADPYFEMNMVTVFRERLFTEWFSDVDHIYEFGCGTGHNLIAIAGMFPEKNLHGLDFAEVSERIIDATRAHHKINIDGGLIDLTQPDESIKLEPNSAVFTIGALEQLGTGFEPFLEFILRAKPALCINVETLYELYDNGDRYDDVARRYLDKRGYLNGLVNRLQELERQNRIEILDTQRTFGSLFHEGYSYVVWRARS